MGVLKHIFILIRNPLAKTHQLWFILIFALFLSIPKEMKENAARYYSQGEIYNMVDSIQNAQTINHNNNNNCNKSNRSNRSLNSNSKRFPPRSPPNRMQYKYQITSTPTKVRSILIISFVFLLKVYSFTSGEAGIKFVHRN